MHRTPAPGPSARITLAGLVTPADLAPLADVLSLAPVRCWVDCTGMTGLTGQAYLDLAGLVARGWRLGCDVALAGGSEHVWTAARKEASALLARAGVESNLAGARKWFRGLLALVQFRRPKTHLN